VPSGVALQIIGDKTSIIEKGTSAAHDLSLPGALRSSVGETTLARHLYFPRSSITLLSLLFRSFGQPSSCALNYDTVCFQWRFI